MNTYIICNTLTSEYKTMHSLKSACEYISKLSREDKEIYLLGDKVYNYDYMQATETTEEYYKRMKEMKKRLWN